MRTLEKICDEVAANGYAGLTEEEVEAYIAWKTDRALKDAEFQSKLKANQDIAAGVIKAQQAIAENAINRYNEVLANQFAPVSL